MGRSPKKTEVTMPGSVRGGASRSSLGSSAKGTREGWQVVRASWGRWLSCLGSGLSAFPFAPLYPLPLSPCL